MKTLTVFLNFLFVGFLCLVCAQTAFRWIPEGTLYGEKVEQETSPAPTLSSWFDGSYQKAFESWFNKQAGFRSTWVRIHNQINFSIFRDISAKTQNPIVVGKDNWLYSMPFIADYVKPRDVHRRELVKVANKLKQFQDELTKRGIVCLLIISPNKAEIYPEFIPDVYTRIRQAGKGTDYQRIIPLLDNRGIHYIDCHELFLRHKDQSPYKLFPRGGIHWNHYGAFLVAKRVYGVLREQTGKDIPIPVCESVSLEMPRGRDNDLGDLINIWWTRATMEPTPYPNIRTTMTDSSYLPDLLFVGDSFINRLTDQMDRAKLYRKRDSVFYYRTVKSYPARGNIPLNPEEIDWEQMLLTRDAVILETNEAFLPDLGMGFMEDALKYLKRNPP